MIATAHSGIANQRPNLRIRSTSKFLSTKKSQVHFSTLNTKNKRQIQQRIYIIADSQASTEVLVDKLVNISTGILKIFGVGREQYIQRKNSANEDNIIVEKGDINSLIDVIKIDFENAYFVTGNISRSIYDDNCYFADPTVRFRGLDRWQRNIQLLVPFFEGQQIELFGIEELESQNQIKAKWELKTLIKLPWKPQVVLEGYTIYETNEDQNKIISHIEYWTISSFEAILMLFKPFQSSQLQ